MCTEHGPRPRGLTRRRALTTAAATATALGFGVGGAMAATSASASASAGGVRGWSRHGLLDLTYVLSPATPPFNIGEEAKRSTVATIAQDEYYMQEWQIIEHIGTHVDAPAHFTAGGRTSDQLRLEELITPAVVIDIAARAAHDADALLTVDDVRAFEKRHGRIPVGAAVLMYSGWGAKVGDVPAYRGVDAQGVLHFPGFSPEATSWLITNRRIRSIGVDTLSIDNGPSETFETHVVLTGADRYGLENLANLHRLPPTGARITVGLVPFGQGSGGQARIFATW